MIFCVSVRPYGIELAKDSIIVTRGFKLITATFCVSLFAAQISNQTAAADRLPHSNRVKACSAALITISLSTSSWIVGTAFERFASAKAEVEYLRFEQSRLASEITQLKKRNADIDLFSTVTSADQLYLAQTIESSQLRSHPLSIRFVPQVHALESATQVLTEQADIFSSDELWAKHLDRKVIESQLQIYHLLARETPAEIFIEGILSTESLSTRLSESDLELGRRVVRMMSDLSMVRGADAGKRSLFIGDSRDFKFRALVSAGAFEKSVVPTSYEELNELQKRVLFLYGGDFLAYVHGHTQRIRGTEPKLAEGKRSLREVFEVREVHAIQTIYDEASSNEAWLIYGAGHRFEDYRHEGFTIERVSPLSPQK